MIARLPMNLVAVWLMAWRFSIRSASFKLLRQRTVALLTLAANPGPLPEERE
jgi:hypothetical protein